MRDAGRRIAGLITERHDVRVTKSAAWSSALAVLAIAAGCSSSSDGTDGAEGSGGSGSSGNGSGSASSSSGGTSGGSGAGAGSMSAEGGFINIGGNMTGNGGAGNDDGGFKACEGLVLEGEQVAERSPIDIYLVFDRTASMGNDCAYTPGTSPPVNSKACFATYAMAEYLQKVDPADQTRLAFQFMSLADNDCNGQPYSTPRIAMTPLPVAADHAIIRTISDERFQGGFGTHIEGALRGLSAFTIAHARDVAKPAGRTTIGVLMTDGDPNGCNENIDGLARLVEDHLTESQGEVKMFFIGETGATLASLEKYALKGGAAAHTDFCGNGPNPCHYWDVGDGRPEALASALASIVGQATVTNPIPCTFTVPDPPQGQSFDSGKVNVEFTEKNGTPVNLYRVADEAACGDDGGWHYDDAAAPERILLCKKSCDAVSQADKGRIAVEFGCDTRTAPIR